MAEFESKLVEIRASTGSAARVYELPLLTTSLIVYDDLSHPPATYIGTEYQYRTADGSYNNICDPNMGKACMPYARSVQQMHPLPLSRLPDAGLVFDTLLRRQQVKFFSPSCLNTYTSSLSYFIYFLVQEAPCWTIQYDVLVRCASHSYVRKLAII